MNKKTKKKRMSSITAKRFARSLTQQCRIEITLAVLRIAKLPESDFDTVWDVPGGFRVRKGDLGTLNVLTWAAAEQLVETARKPAGSVAHGVQPSSRARGVGGVR